jgi:hypothetical protein
LNVRGHLAAAKARGVVLGKPKGYRVQNSEVGLVRGRAAAVANADAFAERLRPVLAELEFDRRGYATARGAPL